MRRGIYVCAGVQNNEKCIAIGTIMNDHWRHTLAVIAVYGLFLAVQAQSSGSGPSNATSGSGEGSGAGGPSQGNSVP